MAWLDGYSQRIPITVGTVTGSLTDFPLFVKLTNTNAPDLFTNLTTSYGYAFADDFESYSAGQINGLGGWTAVGAASYSTVSTAVKFTGNNSLRIQGNGATIEGAYRDFTNVNRGSISFMFYRTDLTNNFQIQLREGTTQCVKIQCNASNFMYEEYSTGTVRNFWPLAITTWYRMEIQWKKSVSDGYFYHRTIMTTYSAGSPVETACAYPWVRMRNEPTNGIDRFQIQSTQLTTSQYAYIDNITQGNTPQWQKMAITKEDGTTRCYAQIVKANFIDKEIYMWIKVPTCATGTKLYIYYDYTKTITSDDSYLGDNNQTGGNVWDSSFATVHTMEANGGATNAWEGRLAADDSVASGTQHWMTKGAAGQPAQKEHSLLGYIENFVGGNYYLQTVDHVDLSPARNGGTGAATYEVVFSPGTLTYSQVFASKYTNASSNREFKIYEDSATHKIKFLLSDTDGTTEHTVLSNSAMSSATDYYYAVGVLNTTTDKMTLYVNGVKQTDEYSFTSAYIKDGTATLMLGRDTQGNYCKGSVALFRLSSVARSADWIAASSSSIFGTLASIGAQEKVTPFSVDINWGIRTAKENQTSWKVGIVQYLTTMSWKIIASISNNISWKVGWGRLQQLFSWKILKQLFATFSWKVGVITKEDDISWWIKKAPGLSGWLKRIPIEVSGTVTGEHTNFPLFIKLDNNNAPELWSTLCPSDAPYGLDKVFDDYTVGALSGQDVNAANPSGWVTGGRPEASYFQIYTNTNAGSNGNTNRKTLRIMSYDLTTQNYVQYNFNNPSHSGSIEFAVNFNSTTIETHSRIELRESDGIGTVLAIESDMDRKLSVEYPNTFSISHGDGHTSTSWFKFRVDWRGKDDLTNQEIRIFLKRFTVGNSKGYWEQVCGWTSVTWNANGINQIQFGIRCASVLFIYCDEIKYQTYPRHLDLLMTTGDGATPCQTELVRVDRDSKQLWLYTKVPNFKQGTRLYLYYDKNAETTFDDINAPLYVGETGQTAAVSTWDAGFNNIYHMAAKGEEGDLSACIFDSIHPSVGTGLSGVYYNEDDTYGAVTQPSNGSAAAWNAGSGSGNSRDTFTAELLVKTTQLWANTTQIFQRGNYALSDARAYRVTEDASGHLNLLIANSSGQDSAPNVNILSNDTLSLNDWWYIAIRGDKNSGKANIFMGKATTSPSAIKQANEATFNWSLKSLSNAVEWAYRLYGNSTELRVSNVARSDDWLKATFSNLLETNFLDISSTEPSAPLHITDVAWKVGVHTDQSIILWTILGKISETVSWRIFNAIPERIDQLVEWGIRAGKMDEVRWGISALWNNELKWKIGWGELATRIGWRINFIISSIEFLQRIHLSTDLNILNSNLLIVAKESVHGINSLLRTTCETPFKIGYEVLIKQYELLNKLGSWFVLQSKETPNIILEYVKTSMETLNNITEQLKQENRIDNAVLSTQLVTISNRLINIIESADINENAMAFDISNARFYVDGEDITDYVSDGDITISEEDYVNTVSLNLTNLDLYHQCKPSKLDTQTAKMERITVVITRDSIDYTYKFLLEEREADQQVAEDSFTIWGRSRAAILDEPYWRKDIMPGVEIKETYLSGSAKSIIQQILADTYKHYNNIAPITLTFNIDDYIVPDQIFSTKDKSPIACIQELAEAGGGIVRSGKSNQLIIRYKYPMSMKDSGTLTSLTVNHDFDDYNDIITMSDTYTPPTGYNAVYVTGKQDEGADLSGDFVIDSINHPDGSFDIIDGEHEDAWLRLYLVPLISESDYEIEETNGTGVFMGEYEEKIEDEYITVTGETAQTQRVITSGFSYEWIGDQAGNISVTEDNNNQLTVTLGSGYVGGVIKCSYTTKYHLWKFQGITVDVVATFAVRQIEQVI